MLRNCKQLRAKNHNGITFLSIPNGITYSKWTTNIIYIQYANEIREYVNRVCKGPWSSGHEDVLQAGLRVRIENEKDLFLLKNEIWIDIVKNV